MHRKQANPVFKSVSHVLRQYLLIAVLAAFFLFQVIKFIKLSILDFDGHHDAYVVASAIGVSEGRVLYRDIFWQYGPLQPYFLAGLIKALPFLSALTVARLAGLALILLTFLVVLIQPSFNKKHLREVLVVKLIILILFFGMQDSYYGVPFLFWPNHLLILFVALSLNQLIKQIQKPGDNTKLSFVLQGLYLALITLSRPQFLLIILLLLVLITIHFQSNDKTSRLKHLLSGFSLPLLIVCIYMTRYHVLRDFFEQTFSWPRDAYDSQLIYNFKQILGELVKSNLVLVILVTVLMADFFLNFFGRIWREIFIYLLVSYCAFKIFFGTFVIWTAANVYPARISIVFLEITIFAMTLLGGLYVLSSFLFGLFRRKTNHSTTLLHLTVIGLAALSVTQAFPVFDTRHTNWAILGLAPLPIALLSGVARRHLNIFITFCLVLIFCMFLETQRTSSSYETLERVRGEEGFVDGGVWTLAPNDSMSTSTRRSTSLNTEFQFLSSVLSHDEQAIFLSEDAAFSIFDGTWRSKDKWFVSWGPVPVLSTRLRDEKYPPIVLDELTVSNFDRGQLYASGYELTHQMGRLSIFRMVESEN